LAGRNATSIDASLRSARHIVYCKVLLSYAAWRKLARNAEALIDTGCFDGGAILRHGRCRGEDHDGSRRQNKCAHDPPLDSPWSDYIIAQECRRVERS
jgi:hypothetical protein